MSHSHCRWSLLLAGAATLCVCLSPGAGAQTLRVAADSPLITPTSANPTDTTAHAARLRDVQQQLATELRAQWKAVPADFLPRWNYAVRAAERATHITWKGPPAAVLLVADNGSGFKCPEGRCDGRFEGMRIVTTDGATADTTVVAVILVAESMRYSEDVWHHELTHALLAQRGLMKASERHDSKYFGWIETQLAVRSR